MLLLGGLVVANGIDINVDTMMNLGKAVLTISVGWLIGWLVFQKITFQLPRGLEQLEHFIGVMSLGLTLLFWLVLV